MSGGKVYCIDTSSLMEGRVRMYPPQVFAQLWRNVEQLIANGRLVAPQEVYHELEGKDDAVFRWAKRPKQMFKPVALEQLKVTYLIVNRFPMLATSLVSRNRADPWVIALALSRGHMLVTEERGESVKNPTIPQICRHFNVPYMKFLDMIHAEGWTF